MYGCMRNHGDEARLKLVVWQHLLTLGMSKTCWLDFVVEDINVNHSIECAKRIMPNNLASW